MREILQKSLASHIPYLILSRNVSLVMINGICFHFEGKAARVREHLRVRRANGKARAAPYSQILVNRYHKQCHHPKDR